MADINFHPFKNRGAFGGLFNVESRGLMQGDAQDDPAIRLQLCSGRLDSKITQPVWVALELWSALLPRKTALMAR
ncbi:hypothetical protein ACLB1Q_06605 [Escherichia coli]